MSNVIYQIPGKRMKNLSILNPQTDFNDIINYLGNLDSQFEENFIKSIK